MPASGVGYGVGEDTRVTNVRIGTVVPEHGGSRNHDPILPGAGRGPGTPFGPDRVPPVTGSWSVVYWVPGPLLDPTPRPAGAWAAAPCRAAPGPSRAARPTLGTAPAGLTDRPRPAGPVLDWAETYRRSRRCQPVLPGKMRLAAVW